MKAKNSSRGTLWPLIKVIYRIKILLFGNKRKQKVIHDPATLALTEIKEESKRIVEKLKAAQGMAERSPLENKYLGIMPVPDREYPKDYRKSTRLCSWRDDEEQRYELPVHSLRYHLQMLYCDGHPQMLDR